MIISLQEVLTEAKCSNSANKQKTNATTVKIRQNIKHMEEQNV